MNSGSTNWSVFSSDGSEVGWTLGVPNNSQATNAHSTPDAWGSNLNGDPVDYTETFLISPAIYLTGGNVATLRFWHSYDFTEGSDLDILNYGTVYLLTNNAAAAIALAAYSGDVTPGWEEVELDLTPYLGHVVYLAWNHELLSFDTRERPGWIVDDVSVTVSNVQPGTIQASNNLWQAAYGMTGPVSWNGKGIFTLRTNTPPGLYIITYADVAFYQTPPPQTNTLVSGATITFQGNYTFADTNHNGISDDFESQYGLVNPTAQTDTDGDGMSDYAEFIAGTNPTKNRASSPALDRNAIAAGQRLATKMEFRPRPRLSRPEQRRRSPVYLHHRWIPRHERHHHLQHPAADQRDHLLSSRSPAVRGGVGAMASWNAAAQLGATIRLLPARRNS